VIQQISPIKVVAGIAALVLAVAGVFYASKARQGAADMFAAARANTSAKAAAARQAAASAPAREEGATPVGSRVIPIGVVAQPGSGNAARP